jgi:putative SOS response-associated peptidase YedK
VKPGVGNVRNNRPDLIDPQDWERWLEQGDPQRPPIDLLGPYDNELMKIWQVKPDLGNVRNNRPDLIDPIDDDEPPNLFN